MEKIVLNLLELIESKKKHKFMLVIIDYFTKFVELIVIKNKKTQTVARKFLKHIILYYDIPKRLLTNRRKEFDNKLIKEICEILKIKKFKTLTYHPQTNRLIEYFNNTILNYLKKIKDDQ